MRRYAVALHHFASGRRALQHRRSDLYRKRKLPRLLRQRGQHGRVPADRRGAGDCRYGRRRLLRVRQHGARSKRKRQGAQKRRQRGRDDGRGERRSDGGLSRLCRRHHCHVRRHGQRRDVPLFAGVFFLYHARDPVLHVRTGHEPRHPRRRQPEICHDFDAGGRGDQYHSRPRLHFRLPMGDDGRGGCDGGRGNWQRRFLPCGILRA